MTRPRPAAGSVAAGNLDNLVAVVFVAGNELLESNDGREDQREFAHNQSLASQKGEGSQARGTRVPPMSRGMAIRPPMFFLFLPRPTNSKPEMIIMNAA